MQLADDAKTASSHFRISVCVALVSVPTKDITRNCCFSERKNSNFSTVSMLTLENRNTSRFYGFLRYLKTVLKMAKTVKESIRTIKNVMPTANAIGRKRM